MIFLDTSAVIEFLEDSNKGKIVKKHTENEKVAITTISINELLITSSGKEREIIEKFLNSCIIFSFDEDTAYKSVEIEQKLRKKGSLISKPDIFIASICLTNDILIITLDNDFTKIEGLKVILV